MKRFLYKIKHALLYAGLKKDEFDDIQDIYLAPNWGILLVFSALISIITMGFLGFTYLTDSLIESRMGYLCSSVISLGIFVLTLTLGKNNPKLLSALTIVFIGSTYLMGIFNGTIGDVSHTSLTFIVLIVVMPILFNGRPLTMLLEMLLSVAVFIAGVFAFKDADVIWVDVADAVAFAIISLALNLFLSRVKGQGCIAQLRNMASRKHLEESLGIQKEQNTIMGALSRNYLNIYNWDLEKDTAVSVKLGGYMTEGMEMGVEFPYHPMCERYVEDRVAISDQVEMLENMRRENVLEQLKDKQEYAGVYRVYENAGIHHYQFRYLKTESPRYVLVAFQNVDDMIGEEFRQKAVLREALKNAEDASAAKTSFLFNMSHDIRTPMNAIMGFAELAEKYKNDPARQSDYLGKIKNSSEVLLSILNNVLEMARIEKGTVVVDETISRTKAGLESIFSMFEGQIEKKKIKFVKSIELQHEYVYCDATKIREVYMNLFSNAVKYTKEGGTISFSMEELPSDKEGWLVYKTVVSDTGIGMSREFLDRIFDEFARERNSERNVIEGTGLGMAITKRFVDIMGGSIEVESEQGVGTTFTVLMPHRIARKEDVPERRKSISANADFFDKKILLAEDNDLNAEIAQELLKGFGFKVERVRDGRECVDAMINNPAGSFDAILMDIQMPNLNGYEASRIIRNMDDTDKNAIPIVALTANAFEEDKRNAYEAGMNAHLAKPIVIDDMLKVITSVVSGK